MSHLHLLCQNDIVACTHVVFSILAQHAEYPQLRLPQAERLTLQQRLHFVAARRHEFWRTRRCQYLCAKKLGKSLETHFGMFIRVVARPGKKYHAKRWVNFDDNQWLDRSSTMCYGTCAVCSCVCCS